MVHKKAKLVWITNKKVRDLGVSTWRKIVSFKCLKFLKRTSWYFLSTINLWRSFKGPSMQSFEIFACLKKRKIFSRLLGNTNFFLIGPSSNNKDKAFLGKLWKWDSDKKSEVKKVNTRIFQLCWLSQGLFPRQMKVNYQKFDHRQSQITSILDLLL